MEFFYLEVVSVVFDCKFFNISVMFFDKKMEFLLTYRDFKIILKV